MGQKSKNQKNILKGHLEKCADIIKNSSASFNTTNSSVNLGLAREGLISTFLMRNLPEYISYHSGQIFDSHNNTSGQIDIVLHPLISPKLHLFNSISMFPVETVLAAIEVKSNLTSGKYCLEKILKSCKKTKELSTKLPFIVFAYKGLSSEKLLCHLSNLSGSTLFLPDFIFNLDKGYYLIKNGSPYSENCYNLIDEDIFIGLFDFILKIIENWVRSPSEHFISVKEYTKIQDNFLLDL
jgi:hypothetical protein